MISAPTLVTSTNQAATVGHSQASHAQVGHTQAGHAQAQMATPSVIPSQNDKDDWHFKYLEAKGNYRKLKSQKREQAKKSRQLIVAVKNKLQDEDNEKMKVNSLHRMKCRNRYPSHRIVSQIIFKKNCNLFKVGSVEETL